MPALFPIRSVPPCASRKWDSSFNPSICCRASARLIMCACQCFTRASVREGARRGKAEQNPLELSGGERQRVGIARALANSPALLLADEPTGNLDSRNGLEIISLLKELNAGGLTVVMVTHDQGLAKMASRIIKMKDGVIESR